mmetsp:Transcript_35585/g.87543  ORF Transcript_35585/g.87543 Transcript_35585/m.87543 type:complete len:148 (+) Transcript_35585:359-802(+)|eukprot:CAMPEP_0197591760 /NCGR_PEP_ID=MMETSP1326-20131121/13900_1 /TAXON_ID=1155430 /ORGANISM="Genus nov. species nov., Strain RCC2288" /LENGTH=147 /DNA_ID=CAMNT_0043157315 /DNA_START=310 /DNA_END=753 /DNA_ORIENTATION=+
MSNGSSMSVSGSSSLSAQTEGSKVGMGKSEPAGKQKQGQFGGYGGDAPLQTSEPARAAAPHNHKGKGPPQGPPLHPWLEYPPNFEKGVARQVVFVKKTFSPTVLFEPLPAELKYTLTRNFGFFTSIFTQFFDADGVGNVKQAVGLGK